MTTLKNNSYKYRIIIGGAILGAIGGYLYYHFIGCDTGTCTITSRPANSALYGAVIGGLIGNILKKPGSKATNPNSSKAEK